MRAICAVGCWVAAFSDYKPIECAGVAVDVDGDDAGFLYLYFIVICERRGAAFFRIFILAAIYHRTPIHWLADGGVREQTTSQEQPVPPSVLAKRMLQTWLLLWEKKG